jgi:hypothetical protein
VRSVFLMMISVGYGPAGDALQNQSTHGKSAPKWIHMNHLYCSATRLPQLPSCRSKSSSPRLWRLCFCPGPGSGSGSNRNLPWSLKSYFRRSEPLTAYAVFLLHIYISKIEAQLYFLHLSTSCPTTSYKPLASSSTAQYVDHVPSHNVRHTNDLHTWFTLRIKYVISTHIILLECTYNLINQHTTQIPNCIFYPPIMLRLTPLWSAVSSYSYTCMTSWHTYTSIYIHIHKEFNPWLTLSYTYM